MLVSQHACDVQSSDLINKTALKPVALIHQKALLSLSLQKLFNGSHLLLQPLHLLLWHPNLQVFRLVHLAQPALVLLPLLQTLLQLVKLGR